MSFKIKFLFLAFLICIITLLSQQVAIAAFVPDWGISSDPPGWKGYRILGKWLYDNGYFSNQTTADNFAQYNYIGNQVSDEDPFIFAPGEYEFKIVYENSAWSNKNAFGYYVTEDTTKLMKQIFNGTDNLSSNSKSFDISESFGLYLYSNWRAGTYWYSDRFENTAQLEVYRPGDHTQSLIYGLNPGHKWLIAWEDCDTTSFSDNDYNDMYVMISRVVPEPATISLLGLGLLAIAGLRRRVLA